jgi:ABC-type transport system involved in cytochrome c biogenesis permease subunit
MGRGFTLMCLLTGSLWGRPMWGTICYRLSGGYPLT